MNPTTSQHTNLAIHHIPKPPTHQSTNPAYPIPLPPMPDVEPHKNLPDASGTPVFAHSKVISGMEDGRLTRMMAVNTAIDLWVKVRYNVATGRSEQGILPPEGKHAGLEAADAPEGGRRACPPRDRWP